MPNNLRGHKKSRPEPRAARTRPGQALAVGDLLGRSGRTLAAARARADEAQRWHARLRDHLAEGLAERITGIVLKDGTLTVFTESSGWCARLRYVLMECEAALRAAEPGVREVRVKVLPAHAATRRSR